MGFLWRLPSGRLSTVAECGRVIRIGCQTRRMFRTGTLGGSPRIPGHSVLPRRVHRRYWRTWNWTRVCQSPELELVQGTVKRMAISLLVTQLLRVAQEGRLVEEKMSLGSAGMPVCFSGERQGHGLNRCSQMNTSFPFLPPGWLVDVRNGQYWATRTERTGLGSPPGNEGWSGREGQPPWPSGIKVRLTLVG